MKRNSLIIAGVFLILLLLSIGLFLSLQEKEADNTDTASNDITGIDYEADGIIKEIYGSLFKITVAGGEDRDFLLMDRVLYLCLPEDEEYYNYLKNIDRDNLETSFFIKREDVPNKLEVGDEVELFLFEFTPEKIFIKGIAEADC